MKTTAPDCTSTAPVTTTRRFRGSSHRTRSDSAGGDANLYAYVYGDPIDLIDPYSLLSFGGVVGKIWNVPNTTIGLAYGGVQIPFGARPSIGANGIEFQNVPLQNLFGRDVTLGNVSCFGSGPLGKLCTSRSNQVQRNESIGG